MKLYSKVVIGYSIQKLIFGGKNKLNKKQELPSFYRIIEVVHALPGRVRLKIYDLKDNENLKKRLYSQLSKINEISMIDINTISGTMLIKYDEDKLDEKLLIPAIIKLAGLEEEVEKSKKPLLDKEVKNITEAINKAIFNKTKGIVDAKSLLPIVLIYLAVSNIIKADKVVKPGPITLFYWAYNLLGIKGR